MTLNMWAVIIHILMNEIVIVENILKNIFFIQIFFFSL